MITRFNRAMGDIFAYGYALVFLLTFGEVMARYLFNHPTQWTLEITLLLAGLHYILAGPQVSADDGHIAVTAVTDHLPFSVQRILVAFGLLVAVTCCAILTWASWNQAAFSIEVHERTGTILNSPMPIVLKCALVLAFILMALQSAAKLLPGRGDR